MSQQLKPRVLRFEIEEKDAGTTIKKYLMQKVGFSSKQLSRFKYRKDGILLNGEKRYVNAPLQTGDVLEIRLTQGGEAAENPGELPGETTGADKCVTGGYSVARDGRLQKIWVKPVDWLSALYPLKILYEDQDILAADKPSGVVCHPSPGHFDDTLSNQVAEYLGCIGRELDVRVTGRLDKDTSGIVVFALNTETAAQLIKQREASIMSKIYIARVRGHFTDISTAGPVEHPAKAGPVEHLAKAGLVDHPAKAGPVEHPAKTGLVEFPLRRESPGSFRMIVAEDGKKARTHYRVLAETEDGTSLIACRIEHGRTHQIRVHMASTGHPLVGDRLYGTEASGGNFCSIPVRQPDQRDKRDAETGRGMRREQTEPEFPQVPLMLHAYRAELVQPFTGNRIRLTAPLPDWAGELTESVMEEIELFMGTDNPESVSAGAAGDVIIG